MTINIKDILPEIEKYREKPPVFEPGEERFWNDEYISIGMLEAHLNQEFDAASRRESIIDREIGNLLARGIVKPGDRVLDLGCGPGLYASRLAREGLEVTGIDISPRSIEYAVKQAEAEGLNIAYQTGDFLELGYSGGFDVVMQIYGEVSALSDPERDRFFSAIWNALEPGGLFFFDVSTRTQRLKEGATNRWHVFDGGLWRPGKHVILEDGFDYPEDDVWLDQYIVIDENGLTVYRDWFHDYSLDTLKPVVEKAGFSIMQIWNDFTGTPYEGGGDWIAVVARKH